MSEAVITKNQKESNVRKELKQEIFINNQCNGSYDDAWFQSASLQAHLTREDADNLHNSAGIVQFECE